MSKTKLKTVIFMGSARNQKAYWGGNERTGTRVLKYVVKALKERKSLMNVQHEVVVYDPVELKLPVLSMPHFFYKAGESPKELDEMAANIKAADCYVVVSPEYNHSVPPALSNTMGYFGGSNYAYKPSAIVSYSVGPWGGMRGAMALRPFLSELGCLPVSRIVGIPDANSTFDDNGVAKDPNHWDKFMGGLLNQLEWMAIAMKDMRENKLDPSKVKL
mmetsp:Transcript_28283/g.45062  ORF Transcript_28283/g.45062 Transcript_28283/m.45062 type:complete len:217 (-) Transcript_28283:300-950(-)